MTKINPFEEFLGQEVKAPYRDGNQIKIARGVLKEADDVFVKITGRLGTIIINTRNVEKISSIKQ